jgi:hypothetical protein
MYTNEEGCQTRFSSVWKGRLGNSPRKTRKLTKMTGRLSNFLCFLWQMLSILMCFQCLEISPRKDAEPPSFFPPVGRLNAPSQLAISNPSRVFGLAESAPANCSSKKMNDTMKVRTWGAPAIGWIGIVFFGFCAVMSFRSGQYAPLLCFIPFILMSIPVILMAHTVRMDSEGVCARTLQGTYRVLRLIHSLGSSALRPLSLSGIILTTTASADSPTSLKAGASPGKAHELSTRAARLYMMCLSVTFGFRAS